MSRNQIAGSCFQTWRPIQRRSRCLPCGEACNKIIHATDIRFDVVVPDAAMNPDEEGAYYQPRVYLYGSKGRDDWRAELSLIDFARWGAVAFKWLAY
jgi:hypothetical protein